MAGSRKSTPSRARSSSVASDGSVASSKPAKAKATPKSPKTAPKSPAKATPKASKVTTPKSPSVETTPAASKKAPVTPRKSTGVKASEAKKKQLTASQLEAVANRAKLPKKINPLLPDEDIPVKLQVIRRDDANIIIGRVKLPTVNNPAGHAFLLRRFDTNAVAASSMFRLAFPYASEQDELAEMEYLAQRYDIVVANGGLEKVYKRPRGRPSKKQLDNAELPFDEKLPAGSTGVQLQGTWIPIADGLELAKEYGLERYARPLIEAKATTSEFGVPILTPSVNDKVSTPTSGRSKKVLASDASPTAARAVKRTKEDGSTETVVASSQSSSSLTTEQIEEQIRQAQDLAKTIRANGTPTATPARKRRAANQSPSAVIDHLGDSDDYENANVVVRSLRRGTRVARRRPIATTASALGAVGAVGAGALAWFAGGNLDVASQIVQQGVQSLGSYFF